MKNPDKDLFNKIKKGDERAFAHLFSEVYNPLCVFARDFVKSNEKAEDIVQEVFIKFWNNRKIISINTSLRSYLYKMVQNNSLNYLRDTNSQKYKKEEYIIPGNSDEGNNVKWENSVFEKLLTHEIEIEFEKLLTNLPSQCNEIFNLCRYEGLSYSEIAQKLNISVSTVKTQMGRAMERLHEGLKKYL